ncbi:uncharacterized protein [Watersipora subatra]|uniref:uncharacterized protein n=1 Tax=Watersipora subatra TaxID=2589382 RepID=UPI00355BB662
MAAIRSDSLYVSNLSYNSDSESLKQAFPGCVNAMVVKDRNTDKSKGYGFVRFGTNVEAQNVLDSVGGPGGTRNIDGRDVKINYAHDKERSGDQGQRGGFSGRGGGRGGMNRGGYNQGGYNQGGYNNWSNQGQGYDQSYGQQGGYGAQQGSYGAQQSGYSGSQQGYGTQGQQPAYGYSAQTYPQSNDASSYASTDQQGQNWQAGQQQQQGYQQGWNQGQTGQYGGGAGDYQQQSGGYGNQQRGWSGSYGQ